MVRCLLLRYEHRTRSVVDDIEPSAVVSVMEDRFVLGDKFDLEVLYEIIV